jgi:hypothetical protein
MVGGWASGEVMATDPRYKTAELSSLFASGVGNALGNSIADSMQSPSQAETQGQGPYSDLNYRNGSDIDSDNAYEARRSQEWADQSDDIIFRRGEELAEANGLNGVKLADGSIRLPNGRVLNPSVTVTGDMPPGASSDGRRVLYQGQNGPVYATGSGQPFNGLARNTRYPVAGVPTWAQPTDGSGLSYTFDSSGQPFWRTADGNVMSIPAPYALPDLASLQTTALLGGIKGGFANAPGGFVDGLSDLVHGRVTFDGLLTGMYENSPVGVLAAMADDNYSVAGGRLVGTGVGLATGAMVEYGAAPLVGRALTEAKSYVGSLAPDVSTNPFLAEQALSVGSATPREVGGPAFLAARDPVDLAAFERLNVRDPAVNRFRPGEAGAAAEIEHYMDGMLERAPGGSSVDFVFKSGPFEGKTVDFMLTPDSFARATQINKYFAQNLDNFTTTLADHAAVADFVPMDTRFLSTTNQGMLMQSVRGLPQELQAKLILIK